MPYAPDATDVNAPLGTEKASSAALEFRTIKSYLKDVLLAAINLKAPLTGVGATGTWPIAITGAAGSVPWTGVTGRPTNVSAFANDAGYLTTVGTIPWTSVTGKPTIDTAVTPNTIAQRDSSGFLYAAYLSQTSANSEHAGPPQFFTNNGTDGFLRKSSLAQVNAAISPFWTSVQGRPTALSSFANDTGYITGAGYAALNSAPTFTGLVRANGGGSGLGKITVTSVAGTPAGGNAGDFVLVY